MSLALHLPALLDLFLKSSAVLLLAFAVSFVFRRSSAATRHAIWLAALAVVLLLPLTQFGQPLWTFAWTRDAQTVRPAAPKRIVRVAAANAMGEKERAPEQAVGGRAGLDVNWTAVGIGCWLARLAQRSTVLALERWPHLRSEVLAGVEIRESAECRVPLAAGIVRPMVLLPVQAREWTEARVLSALRHESGHLRRRDCLTRLLLDVACALYWLNPLVWMAARSMRVAQEQACDDIVLCGGASAVDYATQLVEVARGLGGEPFPVRHALAMAQPSTLETRVRAIVDAERDRRTSSRATSVLGACAAVLALAVCSLAQLRGAEEKAGAKADATAKANVPVSIQAFFIDIAIDSSHALATFPWFRAAVAANDTAGQIVGTYTVEQMADLLLSLYEKEGVDLLSAPRVTTRLLQAAVIEIGQDFRYPTDWQKDAKTSLWEPKTFGTKSLGTSLSVLPDLNADGLLDLKLQPEAVELSGFRDLDAPGKPMSPVPSRTFGDKSATLAELVPAGHRGEAAFSIRKLAATVTLQHRHAVLLSLSTPAASKRRLFVLVTAFVATPEGTPTVALESDGKGKMAIVAKYPTPAKSATLEKAEKIVLPKVLFRDTKVQEILRFLSAKSRELDPDGQGVQFHAPTAIQERTLSLDLQNLPLSEVLQYCADQGWFKVEYGKDAITLQPRPQGTLVLSGAPTSSAGPLRLSGTSTPPASTAATTITKLGNGTLVFSGENTYTGLTTVKNGTLMITGANTYTGPTTINPGGPPPNPASRLVVPQLELKEATVDEAIEFLRRNSGALDPAKQPASIVLQHSKTSPRAKITLSLRNVSLEEALKYVADLAGLRLEVSPKSFTLSPPEE